MSSPRLMTMEAPPKVTVDVLAQPPGAGAASVIKVYTKSVIRTFWLAGAWQNGGPGPAGIVGVRVVGAEGGWWGV